MGKDLKGKELGTGISQRKDGLYIARYTDRFGKRHSPMYAKTEREIKKKYRDAKYEDEHGIHGDHTDVTLNQWVEKWSDTFAKLNYKPTTMASYLLSYRQHIQPSLGDVKLCLITPLLVQEWLVNTNRSRPKSTAKYLASFRAILRDAQIAGIIPYNPAATIKFRDQHVPQKTAALTYDQLQLLFDNVDNDSYHNHADWLLVIRFLVLTGYRFGEMAGLRWSDIDFQNRLMYVRRTLHNNDAGRTEVYFTTPKSASSIRQTPISDQLLNILQQAQTYQQEWAKRYPQAWSARQDIQKDLVFTTRFGSHLKNGTFDDLLRRTVSKVNAQLPPDQQLPHISAHSFRDTFASLCYASNVPLKEVQELLGHTEQSMTLYYTQVSPQVLEDSLQLFHNGIDI